MGEPVLDVDGLPLAVAAVIARGDGRFLLIRRGPAVPAPGYWTPVTGRLEAGETFAEAVVREAREEVGLDVTAGAEVARTLTADGRYRLVWLAALPRDGSAPLALAPDEVAEARWLTAAEACALEPMFPATRAFFESRSRPA